MLLSYNGCNIVIEDNLIKCSYNGRFDKEHWQIVLNDKDICYMGEEKKALCFKVNEIQEFEFEMGNGAYRHGDIPAAIAYVILKTDRDPKNLFYFAISEEYVLLNQTKAHEFCTEVLSHIGERYGIPVAYKLSIDTKKKQNAIGIGMVTFIIIFILLWLRLHFEH